MQKYIVKFKPEMRRRSKCVKNLWLIRRQTFETNCVIIVLAFVYFNGNEKDSVDADIGKM